jgi:hypothetical protein
MRVATFTLDLFEKLLSSQIQSQRLSGSGREEWNFFHKVFFRHFSFYKNQSLQGATKSIVTAWQPRTQQRFITACLDRGQGSLLLPNKPSVSLFLRSVCQIQQFIQLLLLWGLGA